MRNKLLLSLLAIAALVVGVVGPAGAAFVAPTPAAGTISGTVTFADNGASATGASQLFGNCPGRNTVNFRTSANAVIYTVVVDGTGTGATPASLTVDTETVANGSYNAQVSSQKGRSLVVACNSLAGATQADLRNYTVANPGVLTYTGLTEGATGTNATVSAVLTSVHGKLPSAGQSVTFALSGGDTVTASTDASGTATAVLPVDGSPRSATLTISTPNGYYLGTSINQAFTVKAIPTTVSVAHTSTVFQEGATFSASVANANPAGNPHGNGGVPMGTVQFTVDGTAYGSPVSLVAGQASSTPARTDLPVGDHTIGATFSPSGSFAGSSGSGTHTVSQAGTTITVVPSLNPTTYGQPVHYTATVHVTAPGAATPVAPSGFVTFQQDGLPIGGLVPIDGSGVAVSPDTTLLSATSGTPHTITATYQGDTSFSSSTVEIGQDVDKANTVTDTSSSSAPSVTGQAVTFSSSVTAVAPGAGVPTGTVTYTVDGGSPEVVTLTAGHATSAPVAFLPGDHTIQVDYSGDANFNSSSQTFSQHVDRAATTVALSSSVNPSAFGQGVTFSADVDVVAPGAGAPTGTVTFTIDGTTTLGPIAVDGSGHAAADPVADLAVGDHTVVASYSGDSGFLPSEDAITQSVNKAATTTALASDVNPSVFGQPVTFTATVAVTAPGSGTPTGTIGFFDGSTLLSTQPLSGVLDGGSASFTTGALSVGTHAITAKYSGDGSFQDSQADLTQGVNKSQSVTVIAANGPIVQGQPVTFTASVAAVAPGSGIPGGTIRFRINGAPFGLLVNLDANGNATSTALTNLTPGTFRITATYSGNGQFLPSEGEIGQLVNPGQANLTLTASPSGTSPYGSAVTLTAGVGVAPPAVGLPTGSVAFYDDGVLLGVGTLNEDPANDTASFVASNLTVGGHSFTATYLGDFNFGSQSAGPLAHTVLGTPTTTTLTSSANPTTFGASTTLTATVVKNLPNALPMGGTVTILDGTTVLLTQALPASGTVSLTTSGLAVGSHTLKAVYSGDATYATSTSATVSQAVTKAPTLITTSYASGKITATLTSPQGGLPGKTLTVTSGSTAICTITTGAGGTGTCTLNIGQGLTVQLNGYTVVFAGDASYLPTNANH
jgi:hypothetical protein